MDVLSLHFTKGLQEYKIRCNCGVIHITDNKHVLCGCGREYNLNYD